MKMFFLHRSSKPGSCLSVCDIQKKLPIGPADVDMSFIIYITRECTNGSGLVERLRSASSLGVTYRVREGVACENSTFVINTVVLRHTGFGGLRHPGTDCFFHSLRLPHLFSEVVEGPCPELSHALFQHCFFNFIIFVLVFPDRESLVDESISILYLYAVGNRPAWFQRL